MVGKVTSQQLRNLGIHEVRTLQNMPVEMLVSVLGKNGRLIWNRANGIDKTPVVQYSERKSISTERTFDKDTIDIKKLEASLTAMGETLAYQLRLGNKLTSCVSVKVRYSDFSTYSKQLKIPFTSADHILIPLIHNLFNKIYQRRILVRLIGVNFSHLTGGHYQINLFDDDLKNLNLYASLDKIRNRFGSGAVMRASTLDVKSIRSNHNPFNGEPPLLLAHRKQ